MNAIEQFFGRVTIGFALLAGAVFGIMWLGTRGGDLLHRVITWLKTRSWKSL